MIQAISSFFGLSYPPQKSTRAIFEENIRAVVNGKIQEKECLEFCQIIVCQELGKFDPKTKDIGIKNLLTDFYEAGQASNWPMPLKATMGASFKNFLSELLVSKYALFFAVRIEADLIKVNGDRDQRFIAIRNVVSDIIESVQFIDKIKDESFQTGHVYSFIDNILKKLPDVKSKHTKEYVSDLITPIAYNIITGLF